MEKPADRARDIIKLWATFKSDVAASLIGAGVLVPSVTYALTSDVESLKRTLPILIVAAVAGIILHFEALATLR